MSEEGTTGALLRDVAKTEEALPERIAHFKIESRLGRGGMGIVYRATTRSSVAPSPHA